MSDFELLCCVVCVLILLWHQILNLLGEGDIRDLCSSSITSEDELEFLLQEFENNDYSGIVENEYLVLEDADIYDESDNLIEQTQEPVAEVPKNQILGQYNTIY